MNREIYYVQNPAIAAIILWKFVCGYYEKNNQEAPLPLLFIVLPIIFREDLRGVIQSTNKISGLQKISEKLFKDKKRDLFCDIQRSADQYRFLTLSAINIAVGANLVNICPKTALVEPVITKLNEKKKLTSTLVKQAEKLGVWCSQLSLHEISMLLKVRF